MNPSACVNFLTSLTYILMNDQTECLPPPPKPREPEFGEWRNHVQATLYYVPRTQDTIPLEAGKKKFLSISLINTHIQIIQGGFAPPGLTATLYQHYSVHTCSIVPML
jgi:hypothetical protein